MKQIAYLWLRPFGYAAALLVVARLVWLWALPGLVVADDRWTYDGEVQGGEVVPTPYDVLRLHPCPQPMAFVNQRWFLLASDGTEIALPLFSADYQPLIEQSPGLSFSRFVLGVEVPEGASQRWPGQMLVYRPDVWCGLWRFRPPPRHYPVAQTVYEQTYTHTRP